MVENSHFNNEKIKQEYGHKVEKFWFYMIEKKNILYTIYIAPILLSYVLYRSQ